MTETSKNNMKDVSPKEETTKNTNQSDFKYKYSVKLSSHGSATTKNQESTTEKESKEALGKIATTKIPADQAKRSDMNFTLPLPKANHLPIKLKTMATNALSKVSKESLIHYNRNATLFLNKCMPECICYRI